MVISFQGLGDQGKGDLLLIRAKTANKQVFRNEVEVRDWRQRGTACPGVELWGLFGDSRRSLSNSMNLIGSIGRATRRNGQERGLPLPSQISSE